MNGSANPPTPPQSAAATTSVSGAPLEAKQVASGIILKNRYKVDAAIASGGMAQVWSGVDQVLNRPIALKILHPHLATDDAFLTRFRREAVASARLAHSSIVAVYDTVSEDGIEAIIMELIDGSTLRTVLDNAGQLQPGQVVEIGVSIADALDTAHRSGVVHRDIKPANIMVSDERRVVVTDFGIAKANKDADLTHTGTLLGTAKYLAPEQVAGEPVDPRADIYSLGVVLFESITGQPPFKAETDAATALARLQKDAPECKSFRPDTPDDLNAIIAQAMAREPDDRFDRASSLKTALLAANLSNVTPVAQPSHTAQQAPAAPPQDARQTTRWTGPDQQNLHQPASQPANQPTNQPASQAPGQKPPFRSGTSVMPIERRQPTSSPPSKGGKQPKRKPPGRAQKRSGRGPMPTPQQKPTSSHRPMRIAALALISGGLLIGGLLLWSVLGADTVIPTPTVLADRGDIVVEVAVPFDPFDRGSSHTERNSLAPNAFDGDPASSWQTETYDRAEFAGLKAGVGLILTLDEVSEVDQVELATSSTGWSIEVFVGDDIGPNNSDFDINSLGAPAGSIQDVEGTQAIDLNSPSGSQVLLWITETGTTEDESRGEVHRFVLNEVAVR